MADKSCKEGKVKISWSRRHGKSISTLTCCL